MACTVLTGQAVANVARRAAQTIEYFQDASGAYPASPTFSAYKGFCWFRDGAFIADAMSAYGFEASADRFHRWVATVLEGWTERVKVIGNDPYHPQAPLLPARLRLDGSEERGEWADFQVDGYGTWLWSLGEHVRRTGAGAAPYSAAVAVSVDYLLAVGDRPCFDWWEERPPGVHPSTLACVEAGLRSATTMGVLDDARRRRALAKADDLSQRIRDAAQGVGYVPKTEGTNLIDASVLAGIAPLGVIGGDLAQDTVAQIRAHLERDGGVFRFEADRYFGGGRWPLLGMFLGLALVRAGQRNDAERLMQYAVALEDHQGWMPEQDTSMLLHPDGLDEWRDRWGPPAMPLLWSSAMVLRLAVELEPGIVATLPEV